MARVEWSADALGDLDTLTISHSLPADTRKRVRRSLRTLEQFPEAGAPLAGRWDGYRFVIGPWNWLLIVYSWDEATGIAGVVTVEDGRSSTAATGSRPN